MVTPAIVGKVNERMQKPGLFTWAEKEESLSMDLRPHKTTFDVVKSDRFQGFAVTSLGPKATLEAQMEAAARHQFDYGGASVPALPEIDENGGFRGLCHNCGARGHRASDCRGVGEYTPVSTGRKKKGPDEPDYEGMQLEDITKIPRELLVEAPLGALDPVKAAEEARQREEHNRVTAERSRLTTIRRTLMKHIDAAVERRGKRWIGKACDELMLSVGGPRGLMFGDVPPGYQPTTRTCCQMRTMMADFLSADEPRPLMISVSRKEGVLRKQGTRYACFVWWGPEEISRTMDDSYSKCVAEAVETAWETCRDRDQAEMEEAEIRSGRKRPRNEGEDAATEAAKRKREEFMEGLTAMGRAALGGWKDGQETETAEPVTFADVEGNEITFEAWFGGGARYTVNEEPRPPFSKAQLMPSDPPQFPNARIRCDVGEEFRNVQLPDKHGKLVEQLGKFLSLCEVDHNLGDGPPNRFEIEGQSYQERAKAARAALLLEAPPAVDEGRWS
eukprot:TRINITY_DN3819_c0_g1_i1.p2 TRINITY_DN3819_c0_g1~~TRINITY_DN3819_c0_g1_i1.p2  ORF type:complete len:503 (+),score=94.84 TRINITY_DN3819_c0_g1_i1:119-1627(+)